MEYNKNEAIRAKEIAEKKMLKNDFEEARNIAMKARNIFPELDNISKLITVCDVHLSSQKKINSAEKDLYGILQIKNLADEETIKKQYRKLALVLHPDKNKFPGSEAAFKLIVEANMILSDKGKRSDYDAECKQPVKVSFVLSNATGVISPPSSFDDLQQNTKPPPWLVNNYLIEVEPETNLKLSKFIKGTKIWNSKNLKVGKNEL
ncbi:hypothetical protein L1887_35641 [Cichorium endivia]|nr:hypothetical protein L1887_35641 [Cichorium endivia]